MLATLLNNLKVQERQLRVCTTVAIAIVAETCAPFTVLPAIMNEYRVPDMNVQNGVLKALSFMFEVRYPTIHNDVHICIVTVYWRNGERLHLCSGASAGGRDDGERPGAQTDRHRCGRPSRSRSVTLLFFAIIPVEGIHCHIHIHLLDREKGRDRVCKVS